MHPRFRRNVVLRSISNEWKDVIQEWRLDPTCAVISGRCVCGNNKYSNELFTMRNICNGNTIKVGRICLLYFDTPMRNYAQYIENFYKFKAQFNEKKRISKKDFNRSMFEDADDYDATLDYDEMNFPLITL